MSIFRLTLLPANEGDCLILSYGPTEAVLRHVLIDGGRKATWPHLKTALEWIAKRGETLALVVLSHIDADHVDGLLEMVQAGSLPMPAPPVWYNGYDQLKSLAVSGGIRALGFPAADAYSTALAQKGWSLNAPFGGKAIFTEARPDAFEHEGLKLTLVSPSRAKLKRLWTEWSKWRDTHPIGLKPMAKRPMPDVLDVERLSGASASDTSTPNGSSIAFIAEYAGRRVLLGADAHPDVLLETLRRLQAGGAPMPMDLIKLPHHASRANVSRAWLETLDCTRFAISTNGAVFGHPDPEAISRVLKFASPGGKTMFFNYDSERTRPWDDPALKTQWNYQCVFPSGDDAPLTIDI